MAETCDFEGNSDMYGVGIRIGYYLQWYGMLLAAWICPSEVDSLRQANTFFVAATFLALLTLVPKDGLDVVEIYITLLFTFGSSLYLIPVLIWRILTRCSARWDPSRFPKAKPPSTTYSAMNSLLQVAVLAFQVWFWVREVGGEKGRRCERYGFLFSRIRLDSLGFRVLNILLMAILVGLLSFFLLMMPTKMQKQAEKMFKIKEPKAEKIPPFLIQTFQIYDTIAKFLLATTIVSATELTIHWNNISSVNTISNVGQTIPLVLGIGSFLRVIYLALKDRRARKRNPHDIENDKPDVEEPRETAWYIVPENRMHEPRPAVSITLPQEISPATWTHVPYSAASTLSVQVVGLNLGGNSEAERDRIRETQRQGHDEVYTVSPSRETDNPYNQRTATHSSPVSPSHSMNIAHAEPLTTPEPSEQLPPTIPSQGNDKGKEVEESDQATSTDQTPGPTHWTQVSGIDMEMGPDSDSESDESDNPYNQDMATYLRNLRNLALSHSTNPTHAEPSTTAGPSEQPPPPPPVQSQGNDKGTSQVLSESETSTHPSATGCDYDDTTIS